MTSTTVFLIDSRSPNGGMEGALLTLARNLRSSKIEIWVASGDKEHDRAWIDRARALAVTIQIQTNPMSQLRLRNDVATVVVVGLWTALRTRRLSADLPNSRMIYWEHSITHERMMKSPRFRLLALAAVHVYKRGHVIIAVGPAVADQLMRMGVRDVITIPNAPTDAMLHPLDSAHERGRHVLGYVGSLRPVKRVDLAIRTLTHLPFHKLIVAGEGPQRAKLEKLSKRVGVHSQVEWLGHVQDPRQVYRELSALLHLSDSETYAYTVLEAAHHDVPVIVRNVPTLSQLVPSIVPGVQLPRNADPELIAKAIRKVEALPHVVAARHSLDVYQHGAITGWSALLQAPSSGVEAGA